MKRGRKIAIAVIVFFALVVAAMLASMLGTSLSAADQPSRMEAFIAGMMRRSAVPSELKDAKNPLPLTPAILAEARAHFADHCALCHGNDGKGQTAMGPNFYPKVPDMTLPETQSQTDGALFATIENGVRLTAMPSFGGGTAESAYASWTLVHFIRHLPQITAEEIAAMQKLNPKTPEEWRRAEEEEAFLAGDGDAPAPVATHDAQPHRH